MKNPFDLPWLKKIAALDPAVVRAAITAVVGLAASLGYSLAAGGDKAFEVYVAIAGILAIVQGFWTRSAVTPNAKVAAALAPDGRLIAGPATDVADGNQVVVHQPEPHDPDKVDNAEPHPYLD